MCFYCWRLGNKNCGVAAFLYCYVCDIFINMPNCAVTVCQNYNKKTQGTDVIYHAFPKDKTLCAAWVNARKRKDFVNVKQASVCSVIFKKWFT